MVPFMYFATQKLAIVTHIDGFGVIRAFCEVPACYSHAAEGFTLVGLDPVARVHLMQDAEDLEGLAGDPSVVVGNGGLEVLVQAPMLNIYHRDDEEIC